jgi:hypothetical protein
MLAALTHLVNHAGHHQLRRSKLSPLQRLKEVKTLLRDREDVPFSNWSLLELSVEVLPDRLELLVEQ